MQASAQKSTESTESVAITVGKIVITGRRAGPLQSTKVLTSVTVVPAERIERQNVTNNWQLLEQVPGVMLTNFGQGTTSGKLSFRGFNGEGEINAVKLLLDGIPSNSNDGNMPYIDLVPRLGIQSIEVVRGTNDPRYGLHNIAGNVNIVAKRGDNYKQGRVTLGSFGTKEAQLALGIDSGRITQNYAFGYLNSSGHRRHSDAENFGFSGGWFVHSESGKSSVGLIARHYQAAAEEAGYLTRSQAESDPRQSPTHNASDEDKRKVTQIALKAESELSDNVFANAHLYVNDFDDRRFVRFSAAVSQQERYVAETHVGAATTLTWRLGDTAIGNVSITGGVDTERQDNRSERYNTVERSRTAQTRDQQFDFNTVGGFVQAVVKPTGKLSIIPAYRADSISGSYTNRLNGITYDVNDYGVINQPKLSSIYAISESLSVYGNMGRTFQVGVGTAAYKVNQTNDLAPSINHGWEVGLKFRAGHWMDGRLAAWRQTASNEARRRLNDPANDAENIGKTRRQGIDLEINAHPTSDVDLWIAGTLQQSRILRADAAAPTSEGKEIDHVPRLLYSLGADYRFSDSWRFSAWLNGQTKYYLERTNSTGRFGAYALLNVSAVYVYNPRVSFDIQVRNVLDRYYEYVWYDGTQSLHSPGAPRGVFVSANLRF